MSKTKRQEEEPEWNRSEALPAQVNTFSGAGGILRVGPAPQIVVLCIVLAQVPTIFPHLRQNAQYTCADIQHHLRQ